MAMIRIKAIKDDGSSYWPDEFPIGLLEDIRREYGGIRFASEYQCSPIDMAGNFLKREWLNLYINPPRDENDVPELSYYFGVDPSITGTGDYCVICVLGKAANNKLYLVDFIRKQARLEEQVAMISNAAQLYMPKVINVESSAAQELFIQHLEQVTTLPFRRSITQGRKADRFAAMSVHFQSGRVLVKGAYEEDMATDTKQLTFAPNMRDFFMEWVSFRPTAEGHDDTLDALEKALEVATFNLSPVSMSGDPPVLSEIIKLGEDIRDMKRDRADPLAIIRKEELLNQMRGRFSESRRNVDYYHAKKRRFRMFR